MTSEYLSEIELYYTSEIRSDSLIISGDEFHHLIKVMRHTGDEEIKVTDGNGTIYTGKIKNIRKNDADAVIIKKDSYENGSKHLVFCLPLLKHSDRLEFALEKCTELGITNFIIYTSERTIPRTFKTERWHKIVLSAMKQSLRTYLPSIKTCTIEQISEFNGNKILFDQKSETPFSKDKLRSSIPIYIIIGPEGGLSDTDLLLLKTEKSFSLAPNRLRSETAAVVCASLLI